MSFLYHGTLSLKKKKAKCTYLAPIISDLRENANEIG